MYAYIPTIVKHMTVAIYREGKIPARTRKERFMQCLQIAKSRCAQYGFVVMQGNGIADAIALTPKGRKAELKHKREGGSKTVLFNTLFGQFDLDGKKEAFAKKLAEEAAQNKLNKEDQAKEDAQEQANQPAATPGKSAGKKAPKPTKVPKPKPFSKKDVL
jgi:hypothetical protein